MCPPGGHRIFARLDSQGGTTGKWREILLACFTVVKQGGHNPLARLTSEGGTRAFGTTHMYLFYEFLLARWLYLLFSGSLPELCRERVSRFGERRPAGESPEQILC